MKRLLFSPAAEADVEAIWEFGVEHWGIDRCGTLCKRPSRHLSYPVDSSKRGRTVDVRGNYRKLPAGSHVIFYREHSDRSEVVRILHKRHDVDRNLLS